jgi:serine protease Do
VSEASSASSEQADKEKEKVNTVTVHGLTLQDLTPQLRKRYGLEASAAGVLVTNVDLESRASEAFQPGDLVLEVNQKKVFSCKEIQKQVKDMKDSKTFSILCLIQRQGVPFFVSFSMEDISKEEEAPLAKEKKSSLKSLLPKFLG